MPATMLDAFDGLASVAFVPMPIEGLSCQTELDEEVTGQVLRFDFAPFLAPLANEGSLFRAHNYSGIRASNEVTSIESYRFLSQRHFVSAYGRLSALSPVLL